MDNIQFMELFVLYRSCVYYSYLYILLVLLYV